MKFGTFLVDRGARLDGSDPVVLIQELTRTRGLPKRATDVRRFSIEQLITGVTEVIHESTRHTGCNR